MGTRPLILVGDGAFQMTGFELGNCQRYGWDPIVLVFHNSGWEMLRVFEPQSRCHDLADWHYADMAYLLGGKGVRVHTRRELAQALDRVAATRGLCFSNRSDAPPRIGVFDNAVVRGRSSRALTPVMVERPLGRRDGSSGSGTGRRCSEEAQVWRILNSAAAPLHGARRPIPSACAGRANRAVFGGVSKQSRLQALGSPASRIECPPSPFLVGVRPCRPALRHCSLALRAPTRKHCSPLGVPNRRPSESTPPEEADREEENDSQVIHPFPQVFAPAS
ncbi:MAG: hypothetical protein KatS3mg077_2106 [Candidatus Binatia bacterium]|nr:MAG: hypothetical protein KatS3mg077_2106 [Candidatus Binatia bacterium]